MPLKEDFLQILTEHGRLPHQDIEQELEERKELKSAIAEREQTIEEQKKEARSQQNLISDKEKTIAEKEEIIAFYEQFVKDKKLGKKLKDYSE